MRALEYGRRMALAGLALAPFNRAWAGPRAAALVKSVDDVEGITWLRDKATPKTPIRTIAFLYMGTKPGAAPWLRFKVQYWGESWLFVEKAIIVIDGVRQPEIQGKWDRDHSAGSVWEYRDLGVSAASAPVLKAMAAAARVVIRFEGRRSYSDYKVPAGELQAIGRMIAAFEELGGKW